MGLATSTEGFYTMGVLDVGGAATVRGAVTINGKTKVGEGDWGTGATGILLDGTDADWGFEVGTRVNGADITSGAYSGSYTAMTVTDDQTSSSFLGSWTELYITGNGIDMTSADNFGAVWGNLEISGTTVTSSGSDDWMAAFHGSITTPSGYTNNTVMAGIHVDSNVSATSLTNNLRFSAFEADKVAGSRDWDYGLYLRDITTGIDIGTSTTGINLSGDYTGAGIAIGGSADKAVLAAHDDHAIDVYTTSASTDASNSVRPIHMVNTMTGVGGVGGRAEFEMNTEVVLGGWANALKGYTDFGTAGSVTGLGSAVVAEMRMPNKTLTGGNYAPMEIELVVQENSATGGTPVSFMHSQVSGHATGVTEFNTTGYLMSFQGLEDVAGGVFEAEVNTDSMSMTHVLNEQKS